MLVLTRKESEKLIIAVGDEVIEVQITRVKGNAVSIGVSASKHVAIDREEIYHAKRRDNENRTERQRTIPAAGARSLRDFAPKRGTGR